MKRILSLILVLVMCFACLGVLASCDALIKPSEPDQEEERTSLDDAKTYVYNLYKETYVASKTDYDLVAKAIIGKDTFTVTWAVDTNKITVKESTKANFFTIDLPDVNEAEFAYKLTATIKNADGETITVTFDRTMPVVDMAGIVTIPEANVAYKLFFDQATFDQTLFAMAETVDKNNQVVANGAGQYLNATNDPTKAADFYAEAVSGGFKFYTTIGGTKWYVNPNLQLASDGHYSKYLGLATETSAVFSYDSAKTAWVVTLKEGDKDTVYYMGTYQTFKTFSISEASRLSEDSIGVSSFPAGLMTKAHAETLAPDEEQEIEIPTFENATQPTAGNKYTAGMIQGKKDNGKYYINGSMASTYYFGTTTDITKSVNFYVEEVTGGYNLYAIILGVKKYVNIDATETHVNNVYEDDATSVWVWDAALKTLKTAVNGTDYILGTSSGGTFTTIGMVKASDSNYYVQFIPSEQPDQEAVDETITIDAALALEDDTTVKLAGTIVALTTKSFIVEDATGRIFVYTTPTGFAIGDTVTIVGNMDSYGGCRQLASGATITKTGTATVTYGTPTVIDGAALAAYSTNTAIKPTLVTVQGTLSVSGTYYNLIVADAGQVQGSLVNPADADAMKALNGKIINLTGYICYTSSNGKYINIVVVSAEEASLTPAQQLEAEKNALTLPDQINQNGNLELPSAGTTYTDVAITWTAKDADGNAITITDNKIAITLGESATTINLVATLSIGTEAPVEKTFTVTVAAKPAYTIVDTIQVSNGTTEYGYYMLGTNSNGTIYFNGSADTDINVTTSFSDAKKIYFEAAGVEGVANSYYIYYKNADGSKTYIALTKNDTQGFKTYTSLDTLKADGWYWLLDSKGLTGRDADDSTFTPNRYICAPTSTTGNYFRGYTPSVQYNAVKFAVDAE